MCVNGCVYNICLKYFSFREELNERCSEMYIGLHAKYLLSLSDFNENWNSLSRFSKNTPVSNFMKIRTIGAVLFHADRWKKERTDMTQLIVAFRNFANAPKNIELRRKWLFFFKLNALIPIYFRPHLSVIRFTSVLFKYRSKMAVTT